MGLASFFIDSGTNVERPLGPITSHKPLRFYCQSEPSEEADGQYSPSLPCYEHLALGLLQHLSITSQVQNPGSPTSAYTSISK